MQGITWGLPEGKLPFSQGPAIVWAGWRCRASKLIRICGQRLSLANSYFLSISYLVPILFPNLFPI